MLRQNGKQLANQPSNGSGMDVLACAKSNAASQTS